MGKVKKKREHFKAGDRVAFDPTFYNDDAIGPAHYRVGRTKYGFVKTIRVCTEREYTSYVDVIFDDGSTHSFEGDGSYEPSQYNFAVNNLEHFVNFKVNKKIRKLVKKMNNLRFELKEIRSQIKELNQYEKEEAYLG